MYRFDSDASFGVPTAGQDAAAYTALQKCLHGRLYQAMTDAYDDSKPLADRHKTLVQGFAMCNTKRSHALSHICPRVAHEEEKLECFEV